MSPRPLSESLPGSFRPILYLELAVTDSRALQSFWLANTNQRFTIFQVQEENMNINPVTVTAGIVKDRTIRRVGEAHFKSLLFLNEIFNFSRVLSYITLTCDTAFSPATDC